jgi:stage III sporulation protein SpoIIIAA
MSKIVTYVIQLPKSNEAKTVLNQGIRVLVETHGGVITGLSADDEMTLAELFEVRLDDWDIQEARAELAEKQKQL